MKSKTISILITIFIIIFLSGCTQQINDGKIICKKLEKEHTEYYTTVIMSGKIPISVPHTKKVPDKYTFIIEKQIDNKMYTREIEVSKEVYEKYNEGDYYKYE